MATDTVTPYTTITTLRIPGTGNARSALGEAGLLRNNADTLEGYSSFLSLYALVVVVWVLAQARHGCWNKILTQKGNPWEEKKQESEKGKS